jgi:signal transduction histidine kinase
MGGNENWPMRRQRAAAPRRRPQRDSAPEGMYSIGSVAGTVAFLTDGDATGHRQSWRNGVELPGRTNELAEAAASHGRLVRDLHDGAQQQFVAAIINAKRAQQAWSSDPAKAKQMLDASVTQTSDGLRMLRDLVAGARPSILSELGLRVAVERLAEALPLPVRVDVTTAPLPAALEASLYFFVSEALTNVVKHAGASGAAVTVSVTADRVTAEVSDDGIGGVGLARWGSGLSGLCDRVMALRGELALESRTGRGTRLRARIPLPSRPKTVAVRRGGPMRSGMATGTSLFPIAVGAPEI